MILFQDSYLVKNCLKHEFHMDLKWANTQNKGDISIKNFHYTYISL